MEPKWKEVIRITADRQTLYMRLPRAWAKAQKLSRGSYLVARCGPDGALKIDTFDKEVNHGKRADDGKSGGDQ